MTTVFIGLELMGAFLNGLLYNPPMSDSTKDIQKSLDEVSPSFCSAKWSQVLFNLQVGQRHNCCLGTWQHMDAKSLLKDPNKLFNDEVLFEERKNMLAGEKISGCKVCWSAEEKGGYSDRQSKSSADWSTKFFEEKNRTITGVVPTYVEVSLGNKCQMMCTYCCVENSSAIAREAKDFGNYLFMSDENWIFTPLDDILTDESEENVYAKIFWEWFLINHAQFQVLRFTGGEPLLSKWMDKFLDWIKHNPMGHAELAFNSNLSLPSSIITKFIQKLKDIPRSHYKSLSFFTSLDGWGPGAELARYGVNLELVETNLQRLFTTFPDATFRITATLNVLAFPDIKPLFEKVYELKQKSNFQDQFGITCYPLVVPGVLALSWSQKIFETYYLECLQYLDAHMISETKPKGFSEYEREYFKKAVNFNPECDIAVSYADFYLFISQLKHRKKLPNLKLHPSLESAYQQGHDHLMTAKLEDLPFQLLSMAEPWIKSSERQSSVRAHLLSAIVSDKYNYKDLLNVHFEYAKYILHPDWIEKWFTYKGAQPSAFKLLFLFCLRDPEKFSPFVKSKTLEHFVNFDDETCNLALRYTRDLNLTWDAEEIKILNKHDQSLLGPAQLFFLQKIT